MRATYLTILLFGLTIVACNRPETSQDNNVAQDTIAQNSSEDFVAFDTFANLLVKALKIDTLEYDNLKPFIFFKSGYFLNNKVKNTLVVTQISDTTISVKLYTIKDDNWLLNSTVENLDGPGVSFGPEFHDFNFDGQTDIYIQVTASNGYSLSRGHLITIDPLTLKLYAHEEARDLANMKPDKKTNSVFSEEVIWCKENGFEEVCKWTNKWDNGVLKFKEKNCPCEPEN